MTADHWQHIYCVLSFSFLLFFLPFFLLPSLLLSLHPSLLSFSFSHSSDSPWNTNSYFSPVLRSWLTKHRRLFHFLGRVRYNGLLKVTHALCIVSWSLTLFLLNSLNNILIRVTNLPKVGEHKMFCRKLLINFFLLLSMGTEGKQAIQESDLHKSKEQVSLDEALPYENILDACKYWKQMKTWVAGQRPRQERTLHACTRALKCGPCCPRRAADAEVRDTGLGEILWTDVICLYTQEIPLPLLRKNLNWTSCRCSAPGFFSNCLETGMVPLNRSRRLSWVCICADRLYHITLWNILLWRMEIIICGRLYETQNG